MEKTFAFELGDKVKDRISGLDGVVISRAEHLFGCNRYWIAPQGHKDGKPLEGCWSDEDALELVEAQVIKRQSYIRVAETTAPRPVRAIAGGPTDQPRSDARQITR
jgi:hypothetical protein